MRILPALFGVILIPPAVAQEAISVNLESWIEIRSLQQEIPPAVLHAEVDLGESEAISLALEVHAAQLIVDDLQARRLATSLGLSIIGTTGLLLAAKEKGLIPAVRGPLDDLLELGFHLHPTLYRDALAKAGEDVA